MKNVEQLEDVELERKNMKNGQLAVYYYLRKKKEINVDVQVNIEGSKIIHRFFKKIIRAVCDKSSDRNSNNIK